MWRGRLAWSLAWGMVAVGAAVAVAAAVAWPGDVQAIDVCTPVALVTAWVTPRHVVVEGETAADFIRADPDLDPATPAAWDWHRHGIAVRDEQDTIDGGLRSAAWSWRAVGFACAGGDVLGELPSFRRVVVPSWFAVAVLLAPLAVLTGRRLRRGRRVAVGLCPACGYDLRATPGRCPECGAVPGSGQRCPAGVGAGHG